jgi:hypothetical protein
MNTKMRDEGTREKPNMRKRPTRTRNPFKITPRQREFMDSLTQNITRKSRRAEICRFLGREIHDTRDLSMSEAALVIRMFKDANQNPESVLTREEYSRINNSYLRFHHHLRRR